MMRSAPLLVVISVILAAGLSGCLDSPRSSVEPARDAPADEARSGPLGFDVEATSSDDIVRCADPTASLPPRAFCGTRVFTLSGTLVADALRLDLVGLRGDVTILDAPADAFEFVATVRASGVTEASVASAFDAGWAVEIVDGATARLSARTTPGDLPYSDGSVDALAFAIHMPRHLRLSMAEVETSQGVITIGGISADSLRLTTSEAAIGVLADVANLTATTSGAAINLVTRPLASGQFHLTTQNGAIRVEVVEAARHGYDVTASMAGRGEIEVALDDGDHGTTPSGAQTFRSQSFANRVIKTALVAQTSNETITITG